MGCSGSKLVEESEAVALCRGRTELISAAIRHRYSLSSSHYSYSSSLLSLAPSLHRFLDSNHDSSSPVLPLPPGHRKDSSIPLSPGAHSHHSNSNGSHIDFQSSSSDGDGDEEGSHHHHHREEETPGPTTFVGYHYARNQPPQPSTVHFADPSSTSSNSNFYSYPSADNFYGFFGNSSASPPPNLAPPSPQQETRETPPPPPPPRVSNWDFLNPFELQDSSYYYPAAYTATTTPSRSSRDVRDEEGIPELEEDEMEHEVVKEVHGDQKFVAGPSGSSEYGEGNEDGIGNVFSGESSRFAKVENKEDDVVEKNVVGGGVPRTQGEKNVEGSDKRRSYGDVSEIGSEIRVQFERAARAASELSKLLEVGKQPYRFRKSSVIEVSSRMMCVMPPPTSNEDFLNIEEDIETSSPSLSSTLQKLYFWEKKLQDEVRAEEKMRFLLDRNHKRMKHLAERGAEHNKIDDVQKVIRKLSTKIRIAIQVVDFISNKINKLRDEELWPQINELIRGLEKMWKVMLECHQIQCQAISEAKGLDSIAQGGKLNDSHMNEIVELELELLRWTGNFSSWINAQKNYVNALNGWLKLCIHYEPEITADGIPPYSPGRIGAPPIFVICNSWAQAVDMISEMEVINASKAFAANLRHLWEKHGVDPHQKIMPKGDMDNLVKAREREAQIISKEFDMLNKKLALVPGGQNDIPSYLAEASSLQLGLKQIFEALENFTASSLKAYEELHRRSEEEERVANEDAKLSG